MLHYHALYTLIHKEITFKQDCFINEHSLQTYRSLFIQKMSKIVDLLRFMITSEDEQKHFFDIIVPELS